MWGDKEWMKENWLTVTLLACVCFVIIVGGIIIGKISEYKARNVHIEVLRQSVEQLELELISQKKESMCKEKENAKNISQSSSEACDKPDNKMETDSQMETSAEMSLNLAEIMEDTEAIGGQWAVSVTDLSDGTFYGMQEDASMQSASVIKLFIMAAVYERICYPADETSAIYAPEQYEGELKDLLTNMITVSDNCAANRLVELLGEGDYQAGKEAVNGFCVANGYNNTHLGRRFMEENPSDDNFTTARDCGKILQDLYNGNCVCAEASEKMLEFLQNQTIRNKIPSGLPQGIVCANKTGEMPEGYGLGCIENDAAVVYGERKDYVICVLANELDGKNEETREKIKEISRCVYEKLHESV